jgi:hypothetical protein
MDWECSIVAMFVLPANTSRGNSMAMLPFEILALTTHDYGHSAVAMSILIKARRAPRKEPAEWERFKYDMKRVHIAENLRLEEVMQRTDLEHGFKAT